MAALTAEQYLKASRLESAKCRKVSDNPHTPESRDESLRLLEERMHVPPIPDTLRPGKEWISHLVHWFAHVRQEVLNGPSSTVLPNSSLIRSIESGELPHAETMRTKGTAIEILKYFESHVRSLTKTDLAWIFGSLTSIDTLLTPEMCVTVQNVRDTILRQLSKLEQTDERVPHMIVIATLVTNYFHQ